MSRRRGSGCTAFGGCLGAALALFAPLAARAADAPAPSAVELDEITVTATRRAASTFDVPASVTVRTNPGATPGLGLAEWLEGVPGLVARDRQNYAQDTQVSVRGFGARASFGIRGLRVLIDGIPATQPDGQSQISHANLATAESVEVLRGPFSALYGNSSGGVIALSSGDGEVPARVTAGTAGSGEGDWRVSAGARGRWRDIGYVAGLSRLDVRGQRPQSAAERLSLNGRLDWRRADGSPAGTLVLNHFDSPLAQDPLGLGREQFAQDPYQTTPQALAFDTRKQVRQSQAGATWTQPIRGRFELAAMAYGGTRDVEQFLAIPPAAQANPLQSGGVVSLGSDYAGGELRLQGDGQMGRGTLAWTLGLSFEGLDQHRRGFENFIGGQLGVRGDLRRDELNRVSSADQFAQASWASPGPWSVLAGVRRSAVRFRSTDRYITPLNPDDSGEVDFSRWTPVLGVMFDASDALHLHASFGSGFETPTLVELAYRPDGATGLNLALQPARSRNLELGLKWRPRPGLRADVALFGVDSRDELVVATNAAGRASYANAGRSRRVGAELELAAALRTNLDLRLAWTTLHATVREDYLACAGSPCTMPTQPIAAGTRLAGIPQAQGSLRLDWQASGRWRHFGGLRGVSSVPVDDAGSQRAPGHALLDLGSRRALGRGGEVFLRLDNALDKRHVGSVIVNDGNRRYFEPGLARTLWLGLDWSWQD